jgi:hypothetical protein
MAFVLMAVTELEERQKPNGFREEFLLLLFYHAF